MSTKAMRRTKKMRKDVGTWLACVALVMTGCVANAAVVATNTTVDAKADEDMINSLQWKYTKIDAPKIKTQVKMMDVICKHTQYLLEQGMKLEDLGKCYSAVTSNYFSGGWGYSESDACVLRQLDGGYDKLRLFGVRLEYIFAERRIWEEVWYRNANKMPSLHCIRFRFLKQSLVRDDDGKTYDCLEYEVTGFDEKDLEFLRKDHEKNDGYKDNLPGRLKHEEMAAKRRKGYSTKYWFDITSFYGKEVQ